MSKNTVIPKLLLLVGVLTPVLAASAASEENLTREFDVNAVGKLVVDVDFGKVEVSSSADTKARVETSRYIDFHDEAAEKQYLSSVPLIVVAEGNTVTVRARSPKEAPHHQFHHTTMDAHYVIRVPQKFSADVKTGGGTITAGDLSSEVRADSGGGEMTFSHLGGGLAAHSGGGRIKIDGCNGSTEVDTGGGQIELENGRGALRAHTGGGSIAVRGLAGDADVATGGGELTLEKIDGAITGQTGGGSITASVTSAPLKPIRLETPGGSIDLSLPATAGADINAEARLGSISRKLSLMVTSTGDNHLRGKLNGGGPPITLRTSGGNISIKSTSAENAAR